MDVIALCETYSSSRDAREERPLICDRRLDWMERIFKLLRGERFCRAVSIRAT